MKIDKAIETLNLFIREELDPTDLDSIIAIKLGIEALKCVKKIRHHPFPDEVLQLLGETSE